MTTETDTEFTDGLSPHVVVHDPRLPSQHTLDAHQLRVLHRAIDTLAFTTEHCRSTLPRGVAKLIDATTSAWQPIMTELIEQQARFQRGD